MALSFKQKRLFDTKYYRLARISIRGRYYDWIEEKTLTAGKARRILNAGRIKTGLIGQSKTNPSLTKQQAYEILFNALEGKSDDQPIDFIHARNIIREFGCYYEEEA